MRTAYREVYNEEEIKCLNLINKKLQGNTTKQQNLFDPKKNKVGNMDYCPFRRMESL